MKTLTQENAALAAREAAYITGSTGLKEIKYEYDLVSGKVNKVLYQDGKWDQFYYQYLYDADNRVTQALSSRTNESEPALWVTEATYHYYLHGPLARVELGKNKVQGMDYAYTLQGWLKGVNGQFLDPDRDMSMDGKAGEPFANQGRDALAFTLGYYSDITNSDYDYKPIAGGMSNPAYSLQFDQMYAGNGGSPLYNGNIGYATYAIASIGSGTTVGKTYRYDQLNRLTQSNQTSAINPAAQTWTTDTDLQYRDLAITYDANGNILTDARTGKMGGIEFNVMMDHLEYHYNKDANGNLVNNRLRHIIDDAPYSSGYTTDIRTQPTDNYTYDKIGNLIGDVSESISRINWTVYGKIGSITKSGNTMHYGYDAAGNRVTKKLSATKEDYYVRDAQGNVLSLYAYDNSSFTWAEQHLYGSSRLGMITPELTIQSSTPLANEDYNTTGDPITNGTEGKRIYELTNHLGNVMVTISDRKIGVDENSDVVIDYYEAEVLTAQDYYAFGMLMPGRTYSNAGAKYKYGFNGKENDNEIKGDGNQQDYGMRIYDPRVGRFLSVDPLAGKYPGVSAFAAMDNNPILKMDPNGGDWIVATYKGKDGSTQVKLTFVGAILNSSGNKLDVSKLIQAEVKTFEHVFGQGNVHANLMLREITSAKDLKWHESLIDIQASSNFNKNADGTYIGGDSHYGGKYIRINTDAIDSKTGLFSDERTLIHEMGHTGGLVHTWEIGDKKFDNGKFVNGKDFSQGIQFVPDNLEGDANFMNYSGRAADNSTNINPMLSRNQRLRYFMKNIGKATQSQTQQIINNLWEGNLNSEKDIPDTK